MSNVRECHLGLSSGSYILKKWLNVLLTYTSTDSTHDEEAMASLTTLNIPVFAGQGTQAAKAATTRQQALNDASNPMGSLLLKSCYEAFLREITSLTPTELTEIKLDPADFPNPESLLNLVAERYDDNPVISGTTLFLIQSLRYLAYVESTASASGSLTPFTDFLQTNIENRVGIAGFSSGIVAACLVASSQTSVAYVAHAVELYRLAFWIGVRCQQYLVDALEKALVPLKWHSEPWSQVVIGCDKAAILGHISKYHAEVRLSWIINIAFFTLKCLLASRKRWPCVDRSYRRDLLHCFGSARSPHRLFEDFAGQRPNL